MLTVEDPIRAISIGVVGVGKLGEVHIQSLLRHPLARVVAICDTNTERLRHIQEQYGIPAIYTDQRQMHEQESLDGVVIATPDEYHREPVLLAAEAGVDIFLEKPLATTLADADAILDATAKANVKLMLGFTLRWVGAYADIRDRATRGDFGQLTNVYARRSVPYYEARRLYGRCTVNDYLAVHDLDMILWTFGRDVESIYTTAGRFVLQRDLKTPDFYWNVVRFKSGATAVVHANWSQQDSYPNFLDAEFVVYGERGSAALTLTGSQLRITSGDSFVLPDTNLYGVYEAEIASFIECILLDKAPLVGGQEGLDTLKIILAAAESEATGVPVRLQL